MSVEEELTPGELAVRHALAVTASIHAQSDEQRAEAVRIIKRIEAEYVRRACLQFEAEQQQNPSG